MLVFIKLRESELSINGNLIVEDHDLLAGLGNWDWKVRESDFRCQYSPQFIVIESRLYLLARKPL